MSAGVDKSGGAGSNGTVRVHTEWDITHLAGRTVSTATARFYTHKGTVDSLDTTFFAISSDGNGTLEDTDFELTIFETELSDATVLRLGEYALGDDVGGVTDIYVLGATSDGDLVGFRTIPVGLDGVQRFSPGPRGLEVGLVGAWTDSGTFRLDLHERAGPEHLLLELRFSSPLGGELVVRDPGGYRPDATLALDARP